MQMQGSKPRTQRKWHYEKPLHTSYKDFSVHLSRELRAQVGRRSLEARVGDTVKVMRGDAKVAGKHGKVTAILRAKRMVLVEGVTAKRMNASERQIPLRPSNLLLTALEEKDSRRIKGKKRETKEKK